MSPSVWQVEVLLLAQVLIWKVMQGDDDEAAAFQVMATNLEQQQPYLHSLAPAQGPISGLAWMQPSSGSAAALVVGHSNNAGLRLFSVHDFGAQEVQPRQVCVNSLACK